MSIQGSNPGNADPRNVDPGTVELQLDVESPQEPGLFHGGFFRDLDTDDLIQHVELELDDPRKSCGVGRELDGPGTEDIGSPRLSNFSLHTSIFCEGTK